ncbi:TRAP-family transport system, permease protein [Taylorella asinigenitalis 14/45]|uniref:TRAP transporter small permease protein n=1 Tax=Taylorella asinigenitalis 14/45 TaxID=1091495 RepID=I7JRF1_9BURK|nr:TRAP transporter small permease subunit [Taylorella asinigenitalis]CCG19436.1 TRAP-family transport system, permease protein [Taylorella asinigenitalis 14/45]
MKKFFDFLRVLCVLLLASALLAGFFQIISRFILIKPSVWTESWIRFSIIWLVFTALPLAFEDGKMLRLDVLKLTLPKALHKHVSTVAMTISLVFLVALSVLGYEMFLRSREQMLAGLDISISWAYLAIPVGSAMSALTILINLLSKRIKVM